MFQAYWRCAPPFVKRKKIIFDKITAILDFEILQFLAKTLRKVCIINSSNNFKQSVWNFAQMFQAYWRCAPSFLKRKNHFWQNCGIFGLWNFSLWLKRYGKFVLSTPPTVLRYQSETLHKCFRLTEEVHLPFWREKKSFLRKLQHFWTLTFYSFWLKHYGKFI